MYNARPLLMRRNLQCQPVKSERPRGTLLVTCMLASSEQVWEPNGIFECTIRSEPSRVTLSHTAEWTEGRTIRSQNESTVQAAWLTARC
jgi:hypothetical protein